MVRKKLECAESFRHLGAMFSQTLTAQATSESNKKREAFAHHRGQKRVASRQFLKCRFLKNWKLSYPVITVFRIYRPITICMLISNLLVISY